MYTGLFQSAGTVEFTDCIFAEKSEFANEFPGYDTKQSDGAASVMLGLWGMPSTHFLPSFSCSLCPVVVAPDKFLSMGQIELFDI